MTIEEKAIAQNVEYHLDFQMAKHTRETSIRFQRLRLLSIAYQSKQPRKEGAK
jgi:hypothetical protein